MIYLTQIIHVKSGQEEVFEAFEKIAIPLMEQHGGKMIYRLRPKEDAYISSSADLPYEIHFMSFESEERLSEFMNDDRRLDFVHLKEKAIRLTILVKGTRV